MFKISGAYAVYNEELAVKVSRSWLLQNINTTNSHLILDTITNQLVYKLKIVTS